MKPDLADDATSLIVLRLLQRLSNQNTFSFSLTSTWLQQSLGFARSTMQQSSLFSQFIDKEEVQDDVNDDRRDKLETKKKKGGIVSLFLGTFIASLLVETSDAGQSRSMCIDTYCHIDW